MNLKLSIAQKFAALCGLALVFLIFVGTAGFRATSHLADSADTLLTDATAVKSNLQADMAHDALRGDVMSALLAGASADAARRKEVEEDLMHHVGMFKDSVQRLESLPLDPAARKAVEAVRPVMDEYVKEATAMVALGFTDAKAADARLPTFRASFKHMEKEMASLSEVLSRRSERSRANLEESDAESRVARLSILFTMGLAVLVLLAASWVTSRHIVGKIRTAVQVARTVAEGDLTTRIQVEGSDEAAQLLAALATMNSSLAQIVGTVRTASEGIAAGSTQIAMGNQDLSQRTEEQASNLQQTAASMEQISASVRSSTDATRTATQLASTATQSVGEGEQAVNRLVSTMGSITEASQRITDITSLIDSIAFQTNILALNAAVEAARAGEQGRGFAVVASEVRSLAQRSGAAAKEIKSLINETVQKVSMGEQHATHAGSAIQEVTRSVHAMTQVITDISRTNEEQSKGISEVSQAVATIDQVTQRNASLVEEAAAAAESLREQAANLVEAVSRFRLADSRLPALARA
jgi:methyl-accepting chemotaxis protein